MRYLFVFLVLALVSILHSSIAGSPHFPLRNHCTSDTQYFTTCPYEAYYDAEEGNSFGVILEAQTNDAFLTDAVDSFLLYVKRGTVETLVDEPRFHIGLVPESWGTGLSLLYAISGEYATDTDNNAQFRLDILSSSGSVIGSFSFTLRVRRQILLQPPMGSLLTPLKLSQAKVFTHPTEEHYELPRFGLKSGNGHYLAEDTETASLVESETLSLAAGFDIRFNLIEVHLDQVTGGITTAEKLESLLAQLTALVRLALDLPHATLDVVSNVFDSQFTDGDKDIKIIFSILSPSLKGPLVASSANIDTLNNNQAPATLVALNSQFGISSVSFDSVSFGLLFTSSDFVVSADNSGNLVLIRDFTFPIDSSGNPISGSCNRLWRLDSGIDFAAAGVVSQLHSQCNFADVIRNDNGAFQLATGAPVHFEFVDPIGELADCVYYVGSGFDYFTADCSGNPKAHGVWSSQRCSELERGSDDQLQSVLACSEASHNPTYRRLEFDLNAPFGIASVNVRLTHYPLPYPLSSVTMVPKQGQSTSTRSRVELWVAGSDGVYIDVTDSINDDFTHKCVGLTQREQPCDLFFDVLDYTRNVLDWKGNTGIQYIRLVLDGFEENSGKVPANKRIFGIDEISVVGTCICNGHAETCNLETGDCNCDHNTAESSCNVCAVAHHSNPSNSLPNDVVNCDLSSLSAGGVYTCDGPQLYELDVAESSTYIYNHGAFSGLIVPGAPVREISTSVYHLFFGSGGPCIPCFCYFHSELESNLCSDSNVCSCDPSTNTAGDHCETCSTTHCRKNEYCGGDVLDGVQEICRLYECDTRCNCNDHSTEPLIDGFEQCAADGCGCSCDASEGVTGDSCQNCLPNYYSATGNGENGVNCVPCDCNGHKSPETCDVTGGNCDLPGDPCLDNTEGTHCETCKDGYYRPFIPGTTDVDLRAPCIQCACNEHEDAAAGYCKKDGGECFCTDSSNSEGFNCESCKHGFYSATGDSKDGVTCSACECYGHKDYAGNECNVNGGNCNFDYDGNPQPCAGHTAGANCNECVTSYFRTCAVPLVAGTCGSVDFHDDCYPCQCNGHGIPVVDGLETCDPWGGKCDCDPPSNTEGFNCELCKENTFNPLGTGAAGDCYPCECFGHTGTCTNIGVCTNCGDNTTGVFCSECLSSYKRMHRELFPNWETDLVDNIIMREQACEPCNCNGHSGQNPSVGFGICRPETGICRSCRNNTMNDPTKNNECDTCLPGYFRQLVSDGFDPSADTCNACSLPGGQCAPSSLENACVPCTQQCFGAGNDQCDPDNGVCSACSTYNAEGHRCEACAPGYFGNPSAGIPCVPCLCYHSQPSNFSFASSAELGSLQECRFAEDLTGSHACVLDHTVSVIDAAADPYSAILCSCPRSVPGGYFNKLTDGVVYSGRQCEGCNNVAYFGQPTTCEVPGPGDNTDLAIGGCLAFDTCEECVCNGNIDELDMTKNCDYSAGVPQNLHCENCLGHTEGTSCQICSPGYYGDPTRKDTNGVLGLGFILDAAGNSLKCFGCDCNGQSAVKVGGAPSVPSGTLGDISTDTCSGVSPYNVGNYTCTCDTDKGYTGSTCRECLLGYEKIEVPGGDRVICQLCNDCTVKASVSVKALLSQFAQLDSQRDDLSDRIALLVNEVAALKAHFGITRRDVASDENAAKTVASVIPKIAAIALDANARRAQLNTLISEFEATLESDAFKVHLTSVLAQIEASRAAFANSMSPLSSTISELYEEANKVATLTPVYRKNLQELSSRFAELKTAFHDSQNWLENNLNLISFGAASTESFVRVISGSLNDTLSLEIAKDMKIINEVLANATELASGEPASRLQLDSEHKLSQITSRLSSLDAFVQKVSIAVSNAQNNAEFAKATAERKTILTNVASKLALVESELASSTAQLEKAETVLSISLAAIQAEVFEYSHLVSSFEQELHERLATLDPLRHPTVESLLSSIHEDIVNHRQSIVSSSSSVIAELKAQVETSLAAFSASVDTESDGLVLRANRVGDYIQGVNKISASAVEKFSELFKDGRVMALVKSLDRRSKTVLTPLEHTEFETAATAFYTRQSAIATGLDTMLSSFVDSQTAYMNRYIENRDFSPASLDMSPIEVDSAEALELLTLAQQVSAQLSEQLTQISLSFEEKARLKATKLVSALEVLNIELASSISSVRSLSVSELSDLASKVTALPVSVSEVIQDFESKISGFAADFEKYAQAAQKQDREETDNYVETLRSDISLISNKLIKTRSLVGILESALQTKATLLETSAVSTRDTLKQISEIRSKFGKFLEQN